MQYVTTTKIASVNDLALRYVALPYNTLRYVLSVNQASQYPVRTERRKANKVHKIQLLPHQKYSYLLCPPHGPPGQASMVMCVLLSEGALVKIEMVPRV